MEFIMIIKTNTLGWTGVLITLLLASFIIMDSRREGWQSNEPESG